MNDPLPTSPSSIDDDRTLREKLDRVLSVARRARAHWKVSGLIFLFGCVLSLVAAITSPRTYRSECKILVKQGIRTHDRNVDSSVRAEAVATKLKEVLLTRQRLEPMVREFGLYSALVESKGMTDAVDEMRLHVGLRSTAGDTFVISFEDDTPERTKIVTQRLADTTIGDFKKANQGKIEQEAEFFAGEVDRTREDLAKSESELFAFHASHPGLPLAISPMGMSAPPQAMPRPTTTPTDPILADLFRQRSKVESDARAEAKAKGQTLLPTPSEQVVTAISARDEARRRVEAARAQLAEKQAAGLTDQHPDVGAAKAKLQNATDGLRLAEAQLEKANVQSAIVPAPMASNGVSPEFREKLSEISTQIGRRLDELKKAAPSGSAAAPGAPSSPEGDWLRLTNEVRLRQMRYESAQQSYKEREVEAKAQKGSDVLEVLESAYKPTHPYRGGRTKVGMIGLGLAALLALAYAILRVLTDDTIVDADDVVALHGNFTVLGVVSSLPKLRAPSKETRATVEAP